MLVSKIRHVVTNDVPLMTVGRKLHGPAPVRHRYMLGRRTVFNSKHTPIDMQLVMICQREIVLIRRPSVDFCNANVKVGVQIDPVNRES